ncbi:hypothetical protein [Cellulomonas sp. RIT-PI-Y]|uniref:hypothetical protein n=1 Tax=Cellulomonas sp. RIT-PI-Y TaxID=3035297 RepID=UPI0021D85998|nr:hypothetical protein [Cellulomonas sp. RIT-PI-Y]
MTVARRLARLGTELPDRIPVWLAALAVAGVLAAQSGIFRPWTVLPVAAALIALSWRAVPESPGGRHVGTGAGLALGAVALWWGLNLPYAAQYVVVNRDPGFLTLRALWMSEHGSALIGVGGAAEAAAAGGASAGTEAFWLHGGQLYAQGTTMVPGVLAVQGWLGGERAVLSGNLLIGAVGLLAFYALCRRWIGPLWALVPMLALGLCLPYLVFTRAGYTEPLSLAVLCGALAVLSAPWPPGAGGVLGRHVLAGALIGVVAGARIDGAVAVVGLAAGSLLTVLVPSERLPVRVRRRGAVLATAAAVALMAVGLIDVHHLSPEYARVHAPLVRQLLLGTGAAVSVSVLVQLAPERWWARARAALARRPRAVTAGVAGLGTSVALVLLSRPWWYEGRRSDGDQAYGVAVQILQQAAGLPLDPARTYDEQTLVWVSWYLGWGAVVLGLAGLVGVTVSAVRGRDARSGVVGAVLLVTGMFPVVVVNITPDQMWASRRLIAATYPALLFGAALVAARLARRPRRGTGVGRGLGRAVSALIVAVLVIAPVHGWRSTASVVELSGRADQAHAVCAALEEAGAERVVWVHSSPFRYLATLRVLCDVEVIEYVTPPTTEQLAAVASAWGEQPVAVASFDAADLPWNASPTSSVGGTLSTTIARSLVSPPTTADTTWSEVWWGLLDADGTVRPVG